MNAADTITIPRRFDYSVGTDFNATFVSLLDRVVANGKLIKLDCAKMEYIDSAGIGLMVMAYKKAQKVGAKIVLINVAAAARDTLVMANIQKLIEIH